MVLCQHLICRYVVCINFHWQVPKSDMRKVRATRRQMVRELFETLVNDDWCRVLVIRSGVCVCVCEIVFVQARTLPGSGEHCS